VKHIAILLGVFAVGFIISVAYESIILHDTANKQSHILTMQQERMNRLESRLELHEKKVNAHAEVMRPEEEPDPEADPPDCLDGNKIQLDCAPKHRIENKGNRNHCVEVAEGPVGASDELMDKVGYEADAYLRDHIAWVRHGLGTRAKDRKRVVRYYNVTKEVAHAMCQFLSCSQVWLDVEAKETPGVKRVCRVMKGAECDR
jgi:hypothetical protein